MSLNKAQTHGVTQARNVVASMGETGKGIAARSLSALHRSAMRKTQQAAILKEAQGLGIDKHPEWRV